MASIADIRVNVSVTKLCLVFIPFATYSIVDDVRKLTVLSVSVYERVGNMRWCLGFTWGANEL